MHRLLTINPNPNPINSFPQFKLFQDNLLTKYQDSLEKTFPFNKNLNNRNIFISLSIIAGNLLENKTDEEAYQLGNIFSEKLSVAHGITTFSNHGDVFYNYFYSEYCIFILVNNGYYTNYQNVKSIKSVSLLTHSFNNYLYDFPVSDNQIKSGLSIIGVDLPLLFVQFNQWNKLNKLKPTSEMETIEEFVNKYVLINLLQDQINITVRNRLINNSNSKGVSELLLLDNIYKDFYKSINNREVDIFELAITLKLPFNDKLNFSYLDNIPKLSYGLNPMSYWVILLIYTEWFYPLVMFPNTIKNKEKIKRVLDKSDRFISNFNILQLDKVMKTYYLDKLKEIKEKIY